MQLTYYVLALSTPCLIGLAIVLAVIRVKPEDLPKLFRAIRGKDDDDGPAPPSLPMP